MSTGRENSKLLGCWWGFLVLVFLLRKKRLMYTGRTIKKQTDKQQTKTKKPHRLNREQFCGFTSMY